MAKHRNPYVQQQKNGGLDAASLILSIVAAVLWFFVGEFFLSLSIFNHTPRIIMVPLYFLGLAMVMLLAMLISRALTKASAPPAKDKQKTALAIVLIVIFSMLGQLLYQQDITLKSKQNATGYIFLIDDTRSMNGSDPNNQRAAAIEQTVKGCNKSMPVCVYSFSTNGDLTQLINVTKAENIDSDNLKFNNDGGNTCIFTALINVMEEMQNGKIDLGKAPIIMVVCDGEAHDAKKYDQVLARAQECNVKIFIVLANDSGSTSADSELIDIAEATGGAFGSTNNMDNLGSTMNTVISSRGGDQRDLLHNRSVNALDAVYILERLIIMLVIGVLFFYIKTLQTRGSGDSGMGIIIAAISAVAVGSLAIEVGMNILYLPQGIMRLVLCICFVLVINVSGGNKAAPVNPWGPVTPVTENPPISGWMNQPTGGTNNPWGGNNNNNGGWGGNSGNGSWQ